MKFHIKTIVFEDLLLSSNYMVSPSNTYGQLFFKNFFMISNGDPLTNFPRLHLVLRLYICRI